MIDIDKLDNLPSFEKLWYNDPQKRYRRRRNYSAWTNGLSKVRLDKFVGQPLNVVLSRYLVRLPARVHYWHSSGGKVATLMSLLDIEQVIRDNDGDLAITGGNYLYQKKLKNLSKSRVWRKFFYVHPETGLLCVQAYKSPNESPLARRIRQRESAEKQKALKMSERERKKTKYDRFDDWKETANTREHKLRQLESLRIEKRGFDPILSFRPHAR